MSLRALIAAGAVLLGTQSGAAPSNTAAQTVTNWDVFLKLYPRRALEARE